MRKVTNGTYERVRLAPWQIRNGDRPLFGILASDFFGSIAGAVVHLTMIWWVLSQDVPDRIVGLMVLSIFIPLNLGVMLSGVAVVRFGARRLLLFSKLIAMAAAAACYLFMLTQTMTLPILALVATITYGAMGPSVSADIARVPALVRLADRRLVSFHTINGITLVLGQVIGLVLASMFAEQDASTMAIGLGVVFVGLSTAFTWAYFPRDRVRPMIGSTTFQQIRDMTRGVLAQLNGKEISLTAVLVTVGILAISEGYVEVVLPLAFRNAELPPTALSNAYILSIAAGVGATVVAQFIYGRVGLMKCLALTGAALLAVLTVAAMLGSVFGVLCAVFVTSAAASAMGMMTVTTLQENMPVSLQAQSIALWQTLALSTGALTILITGQVGSFSMTFLAGIAFVAVCGAIRALWSRRSA